MKEIDWQTSLRETFAAFSQRLVEHLPELLGAALLLLIGFLIAHLLRIGSAKIVGGLDSFLARTSRTQGSQQEQIRRSYATIISNTVFWVVLLFFVAASANLLGWQMFSDWMSSLVEYLPKLVTGLFIILIGFLLSNGGKAAVRGTIDAAGLQQGALLGAIAQIVILFAAVVIGVQHIGIDVSFLTTLMIVLAGIGLAGGALAFGIGAHSLVANVIGAQHIRKHCRTGEVLHIAGVEGTISEVTQSMIVLDTEAGRVLVPARRFLEETSRASTN